MRISKLAKAGPIILAIWFVTYLIWAFYLLYEWVHAITKFLFDEHLEKIIRSLGVQAESLLSLSIEFSVLGILLLLALTIGFVLGVNWFKLRVFRELNTAAGFLVYRDNR